MRSERIGVDNIMWGSDYPHPDGVFPDSAKAIEEGLGHLDAAVRQKLICDNAARVVQVQLAEMQGRCPGSALADTRRGK